MVSHAEKYVATWLYLVAVMIIGMIVLGGLTRLTHSGLSMVEWNVIMGAVPPLSEADWQQAFYKYQQFPEFKEYNSDMKLDGFKFIFMMEYSHRMLGRLIGLVFAFPFFFFQLKKWLLRPMILRGWLLLFLGGLQGVAGWYMVKSGLVDVPHVSHYRLTLHLSLAVLVLSLSLWYAFTIGFQVLPEPHFKASFRAWLIGLLVLTGLQMTTGGFVAGLKAGFMFNTFPKMGDVWIPDSAWSLSPFLRNFLENPVALQFVHRVGAYVVALAMLGFFFKARPVFTHFRLKVGLYLQLALLIVQIALGISTLVFYVPVPLASMHQAVAVFLWIATLFLCHQVTRSDH